MRLWHCDRRRSEARTPLDWHRHHPPVYLPAKVPHGSDVSGLKFQVIGEPEDIGAARQLAQDDRYQFQWWALSLVDAKPLGGQGDSKTGKKGSDKGIDGLITFIDDNTGKPKQVIVQVKSGHVKSGDIRDLKGTLEREKAALGVFITLEPPSQDMETEAVTAGYYHSPGWNQDYRRIQSLTIEQLLKGAKVEMPPTAQTFKQAPKVEPPSPTNPRLEFEQSVTKSVELARVPDTDTWNAMTLNERMDLVRAFHALLERGTKERGRNHLPRPTLILSPALRLPSARLSPHPACRFAACKICEVVLHYRPYSRPGMVGDPIIPILSTGRQSPCANIVLFRSSAS